MHFVSEHKCTKAQPKQRESMTIIMPQVKAMLCLKGVFLKQSHGTLGE